MRAYVNSNLFRTTTKIVLATPTGGAVQKISSYKYTQSVHKSHDNHAKKKWKIFVYLFILFYFL